MVAVIMLALVQKPSQRITGLCVTIECFDCCDADVLMVIVRIFDVVDEHPVLTSDQTIDGVRTQTRYLVSVGEDVHVDGCLGVGGKV